MIAEGLNTKYHQCCKDGHTYWIENHVLHACPTNIDGTIDYDNRMEVNQFEMNPSKLQDIRTHVLSELID